MILLVVLLLFPLPVLLALHYASLPGDMFKQFLHFNEWLSVVGTLLGYWGLVASSYAALGVKKIEERYFAKVRLPALKKNIDKLASELSTLSETSASEAMPLPIFSGVGVELRALRRVNGFGRKRPLKKLLKTVDEISRWIKNNQGSYEPLNKCSDFWDLYTGLNAISLEIKAVIEEEKAK
ncbi:hypothetical protein [Rhizobium leguminosarum]|uniref:hypothetical protein n=1 Tax=Rhizobium leguminosarum TaxID=384 RepID=UPI0015BC65CD|nr:hypothetical protein [Rhizobium leguminosarum]